MAQSKKSPEELVKTHIVASALPLLLIQLVWGGAQEFLFLAGSQVMLLLMVLICDHSLSNL